MSKNTDVKGVPLSIIDNAATVNAFIKNPLGDLEKSRDSELVKMLGEDGPRYVEALKRTAGPEEYSLPKQLLVIEDMFFGNYIDLYIKVDNLYGKKPASA